MKPKEFKYADLHCHPNLKSYGHSFDKVSNPARADVWFGRGPTFFSKLLNVLLGLTRFNQSDLATMSRGGAKLAFVSLYPFEKGFFINSAGSGRLSAFLSNLITGIGFQRIRDIQTHGNYFRDLEKEYAHFLGSRKKEIVGSAERQWRPIASEIELNDGIDSHNELLVCFSIEGAHVFNTGMTAYGVDTNPDEVIENIRKVKKWKYPPVYITFAHNFYNDLCGHARSLEPIEKFVDQSEGLDMGFTDLGFRVLKELISSENGHPILIDLKHMSLKARQDYMTYMKRNHAEKLLPTVVSHGAVNGLSWTEDSGNLDTGDFYRSDINFYDEEIEFIGASRGLFAVQFDSRRIARFDLVKKGWKDLRRENVLDRAVHAIWVQLQHIAVVLDGKGFFAWDVTCIGSDYDGTIDPLPGVWTAAQFPLLYEGLKAKAEEFLSESNPLKKEENRSIDAKEVVDRFFFQNTYDFLIRYHRY